MLLQKSSWQSKKYSKIFRHYEFIFKNNFIKFFSFEIKCASLLVIAAEECIVNTAHILIAISNNVFSCLSNYAAI